MFDEMREQLDGEREPNRGGSGEKRIGLLETVDSMLTPQEAIAMIDELPESLADSQTDEEAENALINAEHPNGDATDGQRREIKTWFQGYKAKVEKLAGVAWDSTDVPGLLKTLFALGPYNSYSGFRNSSEARQDGKDQINLRSFWNKIHYNPSLLMKAIETSLGEKGANDNFGYLNIDQVGEDKSKAKVVLKEYIKIVKDDSKWQGLSKGLAYFYDPAASNLIAGEDMRAFLETLEKNFDDYYPQGD